MLLLGEVHTGLVQHSTSLSPSLCERLLSLALGERVRQFERPIAYTVSPSLLVGVDCPLHTGSGARPRGAGTVLHHAAITGGHVLQGCAVVTVVRGENSRRLPWPYYLARPGQVETIGKADLADVAAGFLTTRPAGSTVDLGAICDRVMDDVQTSPELDRMPPLLTRRTKLRWVAVVTDQAGVTDRAGAGGTFGIEDAQLRTLRLTCSADQVAAVAELCQDLALHDWLLTTLTDVIERSRIGIGPRRQTVDRLRPAIDHLLHLWMPAARVDRAVAGLWESLERRPGLSRQWRASVDRIRDQIALSTIALLGSRTVERIGVA